VLTSATSHAVPYQTPVTINIRLSVSKHYAVKDGCCISDTQAGKRISF